MIVLSLAATELHGMDAPLDLELLILLAVANGVPLFVKKIFGKTASHALDCGAKWRGQPILGSSKTFRGVAASLFATPIAALALGEPAVLGLVIATGAMAGDMISSFVKRRREMPPSSRAPGLDQIPESLLPSLLATQILPLTALDIVVIVITFSFGEVILSRILFRIGLRDQPY